MKRLKIGEKPEFTWSASRLSLFQSCPKSYYLEYIKKPKPKINTTAPLAAGSFLHKQAEKFYNKNYKSEESFANSMAGRWLFLTKEDSIYGQKIKWKYEGERFALREIIRKISKIFYEKYKNSSPPLSVEYKFNFVIGNREYMGFIDEIREDYVIRDHKSDFAAPKQSVLDNNVQFTFYALAFCCLSKLDKEFALKHNVSEKDIETLGGNPNFISDKVTIEYHHMRSGEILKTKRTDKNFETLCSILDNVENEIRKGVFMPNLSSCSKCLYDEVCDREISRLEDHLLPNKNQERQLVLFTPQRPKEIIKQSQLKLKLPAMQKI